MKLSLCDLNAFSVTTAVSEVPEETKVFRSISELEDYLRKFRKYHLSVFKKPYPSYVLSTTFVITAGVLDKNNGYIWKVAGTYVVSTNDFSFSDFVTWITTLMRTSGVLKPVELRRSVMAELHVNWNASSHYIALRKHGLYGISDRRYDFRLMSWPSCRRFSAWVEGHEWQFFYRDVDGGDHFYAGDLTAIHKELLRVATQSYLLGGYEDILDQKEALRALYQFYSQYPQFNESLSDVHVVQGIVSAAFPSLNEGLRQAALPFFRKMDVNIMADYIGEAVALFRNQINDLEALVKELAPSVISVPEKKHPYENQQKYLKSNVIVWDEDEYDDDDDTQEDFDDGEFHVVLDREDDYE